jgi:integrase
VAGHVEDRWYAKGKKPTSRHGKGKRYRVRYLVDGRERSGGSFDRKIDADRRLIELRADLLRGQWVDPTDQTIVIDYARVFAATRPHSERTAARVESMLSNHLEGAPLGSRRLAAVRPSEAQAWVTDRAKVLKPSTLRLLVGLVRSVFASAALDRLIGTSPFVRVTLPRHEQERILPLTVDQVRDLADVVADQYRALVIVQAALGLRLGELLGLRVDDVDFLRRTVRIEHQVAQKTRELVPPKTSRSRRTVPLPQVAAEALAVHLAEFPASDPVGCACPTTVTCSRSRSALLFHTSTGLPMWQEHYGTRVFAKAVERTGLPAGTTSHDLRHHYASVLLAAGESVVAVAERLGHEDGTLVLTTYGHLMPDSEDRTRKAVDAAWTAESEGSGEAGTAQGRPR